MNNQTILLKSIQCVKTQENNHDEIYIRYIADGGREQRYPSKDNYSIADGQTWAVNLPISFDSSLVIQLYDNDTVGADFLGSHTYYPVDATREESNPVPVPQQDYKYMFNTEPVVN